MEERLIKYLKMKKYVYVKLNDEQLTIVCDLYFENKVCDTPDIINDEIICLYYGNFYKCNGDDEKTIEYYQYAINKKCKYAMQNLAFYYKQKENYDEMVKYANMALNHNHMESICALIDYYTKHVKIKKLFDLLSQYHNLDACQYELKKIFSNEFSFKCFLNYAKKRNIISYNEHCVICYEKKSIVIKCRHSICKKCLIELFRIENYKCPICKHFIC
jgi:tetratricopeptide (TPR) repeat protein